MGLLDLPEDGIESLEDLQAWNCDVLEQQRNDYQTFCQAYWREREQQEQEVKKLGDSHDVLTADESCFDDDDDDDEDDMDPLSVFVLEQEAQQRRVERFHRRELGLSEEREVDMTPVVLSSIEESSKRQLTKDLTRLPQDHGIVYHSLLQQQEQPPMDFQESLQQRCSELMELLSIYITQHPEMGYQQGMHELASLLLLVVELDILTNTVQPLETNSQDDDDDDGLCCFSNRLSTTYAMFCQFLQQLSGAYRDHHDQREEEEQDILSKMQYVSNDVTWRNQLSKEWEKHDVMTFTTRWIRLVFSREVQDYKTLLPLWDLFMDLTSCNPNVLSLGDESNYTRPGCHSPLTMGHWNLMTVLEMACACHVWLQRRELQQVPPNEMVHVLLSIPPMESTQKLASTLLSSLRRLQWNIVPSQQQQQPSSSPSLSSFFHHTRQLSIHRSFSRRNSSDQSWFSSLYS